MASTSPSGGGLLSWSRGNLLAIAGVAGAALVGFAIFYDNKRRSDPDYKKKIREKRRAKVASSTFGGGGIAGVDVPNPANAADMQAFFLQEVQIGEELMSTGQVEEGAEHMANAVVVCGQGNQLLSIFQQTMPPEAFAVIIEKLPTARTRLADRFERAATVIEEAGGGPIVTEMMADDDLE